MRRNNRVQVTKEDVLWCYHYLLGREPESEVAIRSHMGGHDLRLLIESFVGSSEFQGRLRAKSEAIKREGRFYALDLPRNDVEVSASENEMAEAIKIIQDAWAHLGRVKPHFSVLTDAQYLPENLDGSIDHFWSTGEHEAATVERLMQRYRFQNPRDKICVEYGCGVGRVTLGLSKKFSHVHGYDISAAHIDCAVERVRDVGVSNITFHVVDDMSSVLLASSDFFYSRIVFQHNPPPIIALLIRKALRALNADGIAVFQVPTYGFGYRFRISEWLKAKHGLDMQMHCLPQEEIFALVAEEQCDLLEVREDNCTGAPERFISNTFVVRKRPK